LDDPIDYPNQVNNVLCFPFIFRGALDVGATTINEVHDLRLNLKGQLIGVAIWPARAVGQPFQAGLIVTGEDLIARLAGDAELTAQLRHLFPPSSSRAMNLSRSSIGLHSFQAFLLSRKKPDCVTHVSGMNCHPSLRKGGVSAV
jgi:hypothetical protein